MLSGQGDIPAAPNSPSRVPELDGVRGLAVIGIMLFHAVLVCDFAAIPWSDLVAWAHACVDLFFVLSGYLITSILLSSLGSRGYFTGFYARRALRIFPAYFVVLAIILFILPFFSQSLAASSTRQQFWLYALFLQNWDYAFNGWSDWPFINHFWSLAVEEQFYLCWPLVVAWAGRKRLPAVCLAVFGISIAALVVTQLLGNPGKFAYTSTITRMGAISAGAFVACVDCRRLAKWAQWSAPAFIAAVCGYLVFVVWEPHLMPASRLAATIMAAAAPAAVLGMIRAGTLPAAPGAVLRNSILRWFGHYSYGLYLVHYPIIGILTERFSRELELAMRWSSFLTPVLFAALVFSVSVPVALLMYHLIEAPALRRKSAFSPKPLGQLPAAKGDTGDSSPS